MQDYWNNPPEDTEPPEWYMTLEDVLNQQATPQAVADAIRQAMDEWVTAENTRYDVDPVDTKEWWEFEERSL